MSFNLPEYHVEAGSEGFGLVPSEPANFPMAGAPAEAGPSSLGLENSSAGGFALDPGEVANIHSRALLGGGGTSTPSLATTQKAMREQFMDSKSGLQRFGYTLNSVGSAINGHESMMDREIGQGQKQRQIQMQEKQEELNAFKATYGMFDESFKVLKKVPKEKRAEAIQQLAKRMDGVSPGSGTAFTAYANFGDTDVEAAAMQMFGDPEISKSLLKLSGGDEANFYKLITSPETVKMLTSQVDQKRLPGIVQKMSSIRAIDPKDIPEDLLPRIKKDKEGNILMDMALLRTVNDRLPKEMRFTDGDFQSIQRNPDQFTSAGFISPKLSEDMAKKELEKERFGPVYEEGGVKFQKNLDTNKVTRVDGGGTTVTVPVNVDQAGNQVFAQEHTLRTDYEKQSGKFKDMRTYFVPVAKKIESGKPLGPAESLNLAYAYAHALDPANDRITEGDFKRLGDLGSIPQRIGVAIKSVLNGYNLPEDVAKEMYSVAARQYSGLNKNQRNLEDRYTRMSTEYPGLSPARVVTKYSHDDKGSPKPPAESQGKRSVDQISQDGKDNGWSDLTVENTIRDMHGEDAVRKWRTKASEERMKSQGRPRRVSGH